MSNMPCVWKKSAPASSLRFVLYTSPSRGDDVGPIAAPMKKSVLDATPKVLDLLNQTIKRTTEKGKIIVVGVGNTSGVGNNKKEATESEKTIKKVIKKMKIRAKKKKKRFNFELPFSF